ncbi:MAG: hypothetical protein EBR64_03090 [Burkholderiaceae bacterium]|nr:hypothetical protein [Burkholderiaceae bacterium]
MTWTADRRQRQRELIQRWKPWEKSTGARTAEGKAMVSKNAVKTGKSIEMREALKDINKFLKIQRDSVASLAK